MNDGGGAMRQMPQYQSHKRVWALKIKEIDGNKIVPADEGYAAIETPDGFADKHKPQVGGYYVVYDDGYKSYSPAEAFDGGYVPAAGLGVMRGSYRHLDDAERKQLADIKSVAATLYALIDQAGQSREGSLAKTNLEQCVMWAVKGITG